MPYLAKLHFASAAAANSDYLGMRECAEVVDKEVHRHARLTVKASRQVRVTLRILPVVVCVHLSPCMSTIVYKYFVCLSMDLK